MSRPHFSRAEYAARVAKTRAAMATRDIELLFVSDPSNMCWLTGYDGWSLWFLRRRFTPHPNPELPVMDISARKGGRDYHYR